MIDFSTAYLGYLWTQRGNWGSNKRLQGYPQATVPTEYTDFRSVWVAG